MQRILSCFTFSLVGYSKELQELKGGTGEEKLGYFYLSHWEDEGVNGKRGYMPMVSGWNIPRM